MKAQQQLRAIALLLYFDALSSREPASTSLENAICPLAPSLIARNHGDLPDGHSAVTLATNGPFP
jgi:hypothetical protein